jgi:hypothetical protein
LAIDPEIALHPTMAIEIAVIISGESSEWAKISNGTNKKPTPAPINVPSVPIAKPIIIKMI